MAPIRTCVLGVGLAGLTFHIPFILALPDLFELCAVLERNPKSDGGKVKERFGVSVRIHRSIADVLSDKDIELVVIGTPNGTHYSYAKAALEAGKHVLVDKPVTPTSAEANKLGAIAAQKGLTLYAFQNRRWDSEFQALRRLLNEPPSSSCFLGEIFEFESHYDRYRTFLRGGWKEEATPGVGLTYDLGAHLIDQVLTLFGRPHRITAFIENVRQIGDQDVDDCFTIHFHYDPTNNRSKPLLAIIRAHILSVRKSQLRFVVRGDKGTFVKYGLDVQEDQLKMIKNVMDIHSKDFGKEPESIWGTVETIDANGNITKEIWPSVDNGVYIELFRNLAGNIRGQEEAKIKWAEATSIIEMIELAYQSSKERRTIDVPPVSR